MNKVKITQDQARALELAVADYGSDNVMDNFTAGGIWSEKSLKALNGIRPSVLARALYRGYEVEPHFKEGDCVVYEGMHPKLIGRIVSVEGELRVDTPRYTVPQSLPVSELRYATKREIWWFENDRDVWEMREGDTLKYIGDLYIIDWFDSEKVGFKSSKESSGKFVETLDYVKEHFRVFCFAQDRKDS